MAAGQGAGDALTRWHQLDDDSLWSHLQAAGGLADVGLRQPGERSGMSRGRILVSAAQKAVGRAAIEAIRGVEVLSTDTLLPIVKVRLRDRAALGPLRRLPNAEYVEPGAYTSVRGGRPLGWNDLGCSIGGYSGPNGGWVPPGDALPWNYRRMLIDSAWAFSSGRGVMVGLVDTGIDEGTYEFNDRFSTGWSAGRTIVKEATKPNLGASNPWHDSCGHGTRMASAVAGPRNGYGTLGVAWGADLYAVRVDDDVILTEVEATRLGIRRAATYAQVVTLAFGTWAYYSSIAQELEYWYFNTNRLIFAAAGTYPCSDPAKLVTFPGTLETVITVTAFDETETLSCNAASGWQVDFAAFTHQPVQGVATMGVTLAGLAGSSGATAVMAGVTALYLSRHPWASRGQVLTALTAAASPAGARSPLWGFGVPNVLCLMDEMCTAWIEGPSLIQSTGVYRWTVHQRSSPGPLEWRWASGETTQTISRLVTVTPGMPEYVMTLGVTIRDTRNGRTRTDSKPVVVRDPYGCPTCF